MPDTSVACPSTLPQVLLSCFSSCIILNNYSTASTILKIKK
jgi:hypothetical protein